MWLIERQWGQVLAYSWIDQGFRDAFEKDPAGALASLKARSALGAELYVSLNLAANPPLYHLEGMEYASDFMGDPPDVLDNVIKGNDPKPVEEDTWEGKNQIQQVTQAGVGTLTLEDWGRIYARIWMDHRIAEHIDDPLWAPYKQTYGPSQGYKERFERDPAAIIRDLAAGLRIPYKYGTTRLYGLLDRPNTWPAEQLPDIVRTGSFNGQSLLWHVKKCC